MPVGGGGRKKPFSGKQKKQQLQVKREKQQSKVCDDEGFPLARQPHPKPVSADRKSGPSSTGDGRINEFSATIDEIGSFGSKFFEVRQAPTRADAGRYALMFRKETKGEIEKQKKEARKTIHPVLEEYLECQIENFFTSELDFPVRPPWNYDSTRDELERNEQKYFHEYLRRIDEKFERKDLSYFELNLETWRQLWRVLEMSDVVLFVLDIRFPPLLFPPKLYDYVCNELNKNLILVLNKIDMCPAPLVLAWKDYFKKTFPELEVVCFTSYPSYNLHGNQEGNALKARKRRGRMKMAAEGALELYKVCADLVKGEVDLNSWKAKIYEEMNVPADADEDADIQIDKIVTEKPDTGFYDFKKFNRGILTIGCVGQPNVGKSSLINALMGRKVVSVSRTPGHTKHFQTIFLTQNVRLCDCPGLIFPSRIPKALQVLCGSYPIAQLREPYTTVKYLAERLDLPGILKITHPEGEEEWCACDIADGWAAKKGYRTAKAARLDTYRGANHILRLALEGRICLCLYPPGYHNSKDQWLQDPRVAEILSIQAKSSSNPSHQIQAMSLSDSEEEDDEDYREESSNNNEEMEENEDESEHDHEEEEETTEPNTTKSKPAGISMKNKFAMLLDDDDDDDDEDDNGN